MGRFSATPIYKLDEHLKIDKCPHCSMNNPNLVTQLQEFATRADDGSNQRFWRIYACRACGGCVVAWAYPHNRIVNDYYPTTEKLSELIPEKIAYYLKQAIDSTNIPSGCLMLCASSVDEMLKQRGFKDGKLYTRINEAIEAGHLTEDMGKWAHRVRLDANDQRHADEDAPLPTIENSTQAIEFTKTLAEILCVLPEKIKQGLIQKDVPNAQGGRGAGDSRITV
jgi:hypothetical protein